MLRCDSCSPSPFILLLLPLRLSLKVPASLYFLRPLSIFCRRPVESLFCTRKGAWMLLNLFSLPGVTPAPRPRSLPMELTLLLRLLLLYRRRRSSILPPCVRFLRGDGAGDGARC
ncbi:uncharacterized protein PITG_02600 [Phytophthora infestans T30-4]|uniref:Secreted protein n=1 Tax=Phytophthora infestans (strain T30-4) TaxID=403677 RepID=D0MWR7_PHYIT|nr:uncharacterized protein PITG_02600 [Phytophthora infestans T30-4]EEY64080.1 hypothetical protein PITG_02600 [Phytophthora infestans T30-4]|eukprot:XP_002907516.1 hypothetical protein PITG_02600 [Phytophthora infestans T30-4]